MSHYHINLNTGVEEQLTFPFKTTLSLKPLLDFWQDIPDTYKKDQTRRLIFKIIGDKIKGNKALLQPITDKAILEENAGLIDLLLQVVFPASAKDTHLGAAITPYQLEPFFVSPALQKMVGEKMEKMHFDKAAIKHKLLHAYSIILERCYNVSLTIEQPMVVTLPDQETGLSHYYKVVSDSKFIKVKPIGELKRLSQSDIDYLTSNLDNLDIWQEYLPFDAFEFQGFAVANLIDITEQETLSSLKYLLLNNNALQDEQNRKELQTQIQTLFNLPDIQFGLSIFSPQFKRFVFLGECQSLLFHQLEGNVCPYNIGAGKLFEQFYQENKPLILSDLTTPKQRKTLPEFMQQQISEQNIKSLVVAPLTCEEQFVGMLEIASSNTNALNNRHLLKIADLLPLFSIAIERNLDAMDARIQGIIKEECTAIHPTVEWRFTEAAMRFLDKQSKGQSAEMEGIVFENVYPLFGASDVRGSSTKRNEAIQADLIEHLTLAKNVLLRASEHQALPIFNEIRFKIDNHIKHIQKSLSSGDETAIFDFLQREIEPLFEDFKTNDAPLLAAAMDAYQNAIDKQLGVLYHKRKEFEDSLTKINEEIGAYIEQQQHKAQTMFPHYFEKYRTDGVEYNVYIGDSLVNNRTFRYIYLKNLRLWQLMTTCEVARIAEELRHELPIPLETTHLILVHSTPMAIRFRADEKQFDVDGAYNIRYEIIKKRIDKAYIRGTKERLTQPRKIAIVYSQTKDAYEYLEYIAYLKSINYITDEVEELELERLQGVRGLKAIRITVNIPNAYVPQPIEAKKSSNQPPSNGSTNAKADVMENNGVESIEHAIDQILNQSPNLR